VLLALLRREAVESGAVLRDAGADTPAVVAALRGITGVGSRAEPIPVERVAVSPRVGALLRRAAARTDPPTDLDVLGQILEDGGEPSLAHLVLTSLGARRRALVALREVTTTAAAAGRADGDLVPG
jgi:hypothetical protein